MRRRDFINTSILGSLAAYTATGQWNNQNGSYSILELMGKVEIPLFGEGYQLREEAHEAFLKMKKAAYSDGYDLKIVSSYRNYDRQKAIWERKYLQYTMDENMAPIGAINKIIEYSTMPGTSRHHWGTEIDVIDGYPKTNGDVLVPEKFEEGREFYGLKLWLDKNSEKFGFYLTYTDNPKRRGFKYEPWHYSYAPLSIPMLAEFRSKNILALLSKEQYEGTQHFTRNFLRQYIVENILDINPSLL